MKKVVAVLSAVVIVLVGVIAIMLATSSGKGGASLEVDQGGSVVTEEIIKSFKISTLTYRYSNIIYRESVLKLGDVDIPFTKTYLAVRYDGTMEIGIDASALQIEVDGSTMTITLPKAQILSHGLVAGTTEVLFDVDGLFNDNKVADYIEIFESERAAMEQRVIDLGLLDQAGESAVEQLRNLIESIPGATDDYTIVYRIQSG
ncbi:MAG: DUF4230 domain-containing protein [Propionibacteriaceae bacterium]|jgi:hypothetical protein|nr:DUF4230 domain-containing protein [Propionibacteriaceae bacterium]